MNSTHNMMEIAEAAARHAGTLLLGAAEEGCRIDSQEHHDIKLKADRMSEELILAELKATGDVAILSEEAGIVRGEMRGLYWAVDPLDGTINYSRGIPLCCVSVGLWDGDEPVCGAVYDFYRGEMFSGIAREGAWLNGRAIRVSDVSLKEKGILVSGFPARADLSEEAIRGFIDAAKSYRKLRYLGSAALSLVYVACGRADAYAERSIMLWDVAGAAAIILGAGGKISCKETSKPFCFDVLATNGRIT